MRKILLVVLVLLVSAGFAMADEINLGTFPVGKWLDANWDAEWEFSVGNIKINDSKTGKTVYDFSYSTLTKFAVEASADGVSLSFYCEETEKTYKFTKTLTNENVILDIDPPVGDHYKVEMPMVK